MARPRLNKAFSYCSTSIRGLPDYVRDGLGLLSLRLRKPKGEVIEDAYRVFVQHLFEAGRIPDQTRRVILGEPGFYRNAKAESAANVTTGKV